MRLPALAPNSSLTSNGFMNLAPLPQLSRLGELRGNGLSVISPPRTLKLSQNDGLCYTLRVYRFKRETPESDVTQPSGSSTCEPSSKVRQAATPARR